MRSVFQYLLLFVVLMILQVLVFDKLTISVFFMPLVYVTFILFLPFNTRPVVLLLTALAIGVTADFFMAKAGLNTIATVFVAFVRPFVLNWICRRDVSTENGMPSAQTIGSSRFLRYVVALVVLHSAIFYSLEWFSWQYMYRVALQVVINSAFTILFVWYVSLLFDGVKRDRV